MKTFLKFIGLIIGLYLVIKLLSKGANSTADTVKPVVTPVVSDEELIDNFQEQQDREIYEKKLAQYNNAVESCVKRRSSGSMFGNFNDSVSRSYCEAMYKGLKP